MLDRARTIAEQVTDPELPMLTLADLGVLRSVCTEGDRVVVEIAPTYSGCPAVAEMRADLMSRLHGDGFADVEVRVVLSPPWTTDDITARGRATLARHGVAPPGVRPHRPPGPVPLQLSHRLPAPPCPHCGSVDTEVTSAFGPTPCTALCRCRICAEPFEHMKAI
ncbi:MAG TPA: 1,2-phenylacetyl-CoA epoxidase subunit PaaD [Jatrophihabitantaceae bacterium]|nr:1,2-phenylacetyl-CoA epoxidase subunit PaaD [Jatrophihabitantaceae bacterium]